jgi:hypothetical protein
MERALTVFRGIWLGLTIAPCLCLPAHAQEIKNAPNAVDQDQDPKEDPDPDPDLEMGNFFEMDAEAWADAAYMVLGTTREEFEQLMRRRVRNTLNLIERLAGISPEVRDKVTATAELELQRLDADITTLASQSPKRPGENDFLAFQRKIATICEPFQRIVRARSRDNPSESKALWEKVLVSNLSDHQKELFEKDLREKEEYCNKVDRLETLLQVSRVLGFSSQQLKNFEAIADANPDAWITLVTAWTTLSAMPEEQQREHFSEAQRIRLTQPLEYSADALDPFGGDFPQ